MANFVHSQKDIDISVHERNKK